MFEYLIIGWALVLGALLGHGVSRAASRKLIEAARRKSARLQEEAKEKAGEHLRETQGQSKEEALELLKEGEEQEHGYREENKLLKERLERLDGRGERLESELLQREERLEHRRADATRTRAAAEADRDRAREMSRSLTAKLEERAGTSAKMARQGLVDSMVDEHRATCADRLRNLEASDSEHFTRQAKRLMGIALGRYAGGYSRERLSSMVHLKSEEAARLRDRAGLASLIEEGTGVHLAVTETGESIRMEGSDGVAREHTRRCLARLLGKKEAGDPERIINAIGTEVNKEIKATGVQAFKILGLEPAHAEITILVGRLSYRTSYTQNQWEHALEAAFLGGMLAAEMGLDVMTARRATLLHDIGKALTHQIDGSHAVIGAELARKHGEEELVANAIGAHHNDEPMNSPYAPLVAAADAMSGARPGARREMVESYGDRIGDLERIAKRFKGVDAVHAVQAGREIRVHVSEGRVSDARAAEISEEIAAKISEEVTFPGQIRVIVIREFKAVEMAS